MVVVWLLPGIPVGAMEGGTGAGAVAVGIANTSGAMKEAAARAAEWPAGTPSNRTNTWVPSRAREAVAHTWYTEGDGQTECYVRGGNFCGGGGGGEGEGEGEGRARGAPKGGEAPAAAAHAHVLALSL